MTPARFVTDTSLAYLARRLLFLGYDVQLLPGARLEELFAAARRDARIVLTLSGRHPKAFADVTAMVVPREDTAAALRTIAAAHAPTSEPFTRCPACNLPLQTRHAMEARGEVPGRVLRMPGPLRFCPSCGKWFWEGSHVARLREWIAHTLGTEESGNSGPSRSGVP